MVETKLWPVPEIEVPGNEVLVHPRDFCTRQMVILQSWRARVNQEKQAETKTCEHLSLSQQKYVLKY